mmetsp:Transcript_35277/g.97585  ORF Transcript_35277/g.97585 Transcript_35277/m.97585 type:complete len:204 (+) Transcript_35277:666-1277(+)
MLPSSCGHAQSTISLGKFSKQYPDKNSMPCSMRNGSTDSRVATLSGGSCQDCPWSWTKVANAGKSLYRSTMKSKYLPASWARFRTGRTCVDTLRQAERLCWIVWMWSLEPPFFNDERTTISLNGPVGTIASSSQVSGSMWCATTSVPFPAERGTTLVDPSVPSPRSGLGRTAQTHNSNAFKARRAQETRTGTLPCMSNGQSEV